MAYIYQITNQINGKIYVGKTKFSIEKRFKEHCKDAFRERNEKRPLYAAMRKYGVENFKIELLEETSNPEEREIFWINKKNSFKNGYNATLGGDGKHYVDYDKIIILYNIYHNQKQVAEQMRIDVGTVRNVLRANNVLIVKNPTKCKTVKQLDKTKKEIAIFHSCGEAARNLINNNYTNAKVGTVTNKITECANHKRKSAYGFLWEFV